MAERAAPEGGEVFLYGTAPDGGESYEGPSSSSLRMRSCQSFTPFPDLTAEERIEELIDDGVINNGRGRSLTAELQVALWFLQWNNGERQAIVRLELFIKKVEIMVKTNQLDPDLGAELIAKAEAILEMLQAGQSP